MSSIPCLYVRYVQTNNLYNIIFAQRALKFLLFLRLNLFACLYHFSITNPSFYKLLHAAMATNIFNAYITLFYIGGYIPTDGSPYTCSFVRTGLW